MMLADLTIAGAPRKVLLHAPKNGFFYVLDRHTGKVISANNFVPVNWATHVDLATGRPAIAANALLRRWPFVATPTGAGAHNWSPLSYSPRTGLVYFQAQARHLRYDDHAGLRSSCRAATTWAIDRGPRRPTARRRRTNCRRSKLVRARLGPGREQGALRDRRARRRRARDGGDLAVPGPRHDRRASSSRSTRRTASRLWSTRRRTSIGRGADQLRGRRRAVHRDQRAAAASPARRLAGRARAATGTALRVQARRHGHAAAAARGPRRRRTRRTRVFADDVVRAGELLVSEYCGRCHGDATRGSTSFPICGARPALTSHALWRTSSSTARSTDAA